MRRRVFDDFAEMYPQRFINVTNGIAVRRWLVQSNPGLSALLTERLGCAWENDLELIGRLGDAAEDPQFRRRFRAIKRDNKERLAAELMRRFGIGGQRRFAVRRAGQAHPRIQAADCSICCT